MVQYTTLTAVTASFLLTASPVLGHLAMVNPVPLKSANNPNTIVADYDLSAPISGAQFPCKGYHILLGTPEGASVATWEAGSSQQLVLGTGAAHNGGSCQASFSEDNGATFKVVKSWIGNCPAGQGSTFDFNVPKDVKSGNLIFAWTWFNNLGNREMYMNCASVTITNGGAGLSSYPDILKANIDNGCSTIEGKDVEFPNPGWTVVNESTNFAPPTGDSCGTKVISPPPPPPPTHAPPTEEPPKEEPPVSSPEDCDEDTPPVTTNPPNTTIGPSPVLCTCGGPDGFVITISGPGATTTTPYTDASIHY